ncbi:MAG TPA: HAMP domain-containing protein, partial [Polyangia bacterium]|nr:HAMP domain-containing protein [Polyangia bacterium]
MRHGRPPRGGPGWPPWRGPWGFWAGLDPATRERIVGEIRTAYGQRFGRRHPWDRVFHEAIGRRPGWHQRIRWELRLHYGAHLHRRLFLWFGATIFLAVVATAVAAHFGHGWLAAHPLRAVLLFGVPAVTLWTATGRVARRIAQPLYELTRAAQELGAGNLKARVSAAGFGFDETAVLSSAFNEMAAR